MKVFILPPFMIRVGAIGKRKRTSEARYKSARGVFSLLYSIYYYDPTPVFVH